MKICDILIDSVLIAVFLSQFSLSLYLKNSDEFLINVEIFPIFFFIFTWRGKKRYTPFSNYSLNWYKFSGIYDVNIKILLINYWFTISDDLLENCNEPKSNIWCMENHAFSRALFMKMCFVFFFKCKCHYMLCASRSPLTYFCFQQKNAFLF